ncbi:MAG: aspartate aminotransferase family protein [Polyangiaceae bacterium]|nr:aspartate aminotransferase family protein [Polyangiaceae bacterium]
MVVHPPGPRSQALVARLAASQAPMGPRPDPAARDRGIVLARGVGANVFDVDGNRYVDLAAGFGGLLIGHSHPRLERRLALQASTLMQALGDVVPSDVKVRCAERVAALHSSEHARVIFGQSGADAVTAALKSATLATGKPGWICFRGAYHGLSYAPLAACGLRESYRAPFAEQLNQRVHLVDYPSDPDSARGSLGQVTRALETGGIGSVLIEPILGRGGCVVPPEGFLCELHELCRRMDALLVADEIWTGLGRAGQWLYSARAGVCPDLVCLGKGLGGGVPISACVGRAELMQHWSRDDEVVHTSTFAGAPLACAAALETLDIIEQEQLVTRSREVGECWRAQLADALRSFALTLSVRGDGLMVAIDLGDRPGAAVRLQQELLTHGYLASTGGGRREVLVMTPPLTVDPVQLEGFVAPLQQSLHALAL